MKKERSYEKGIDIVRGRERERERNRERANERMVFEWQADTKKNGLTKHLSTFFSPYVRRRTRLNTLIEKGKGGKRNIFQCREFPPNKLLAVGQIFHTLEKETFE